MDLLKHMKEDNYNEILSILKKIKSLIQTKETYQDFMIKNNLIEIICSLLEGIKLNGQNVQEIIQCLEILSWITINITAGTKDETNLCRDNGLIHIYAKILRESKTFMTLELFENVSLFFMNYE